MSFCRLSSVYSPPHTLFWDDILSSSRIIICWLKWSLCFGQNVFRLTVIQEFCFKIKSETYGQKNVAFIGTYKLQVKIHKLVVEK
jgi:hypothetical protein